MSLTSNLLYDRYTFDTTYLSLQWRSDVGTIRNAWDGSNLVFELTDWSIDWLIQPNGISGVEAAEVDHEH